MLESRLRRRQHARQRRFHLDAKMKINLRDEYPSGEEMARSVLGGLLRVGVSTGEPPTTILLFNQSLKIHDDLVVTAVEKSALTCRDVKITFSSTEC